MNSPRIITNEVRMKLDQIMRVNEKYAKALETLHSYGNYSPFAHNTKKHLVVFVGRNNAYKELTYLGFRYNKYRTWVNPTHAIEYLRK